MSPEHYAQKAIRLYQGVNPEVSFRECIVSVIREARADAYRSVLSILEEHQKHDTFAHLDELEDQIKQQMNTDP